MSEATPPARSARAPARAAWTVVVAVLALVAPAARAADEVVVPGGLAHVTKLLDGIARTDDRFLDRVNRVLLGVVRADGSWEGNADRATLRAYVQVMRDLEAAFDSPLELAPEDRAIPERFAEVANILGYQASIGEAAVEIAAAGTDPATAARREVARGLGWNVHYIAAKLSSGERVTLSWGRDVVPSPLPFDAWETLTGARATPESAFEILIEDQAFGLVLEASRRLSAGTRTALGDAFLPWAYREAPIRLFRYASMIRFRDGRLALPGGPDAAPYWTALVGRSPEEDPVAFVKALLTDPDGVRPFVAWSVTFLPDDRALEIVRAFAGSGSDLPDRFRSIVKEIGGARYFDSPRTGRFDLARLLRALDVGGPSGQPGAVECRAWWAADLAGGTPGPDRLDGEVERATAALDPGRCLEHMLVDRVVLRDWSVLRGDRVAAVARTFEGRPQLATPANVFLLGRIATGPRSAVAPIRRLDLERPETLQRYLLAVDRLGRLDPGPPDAGLALRFQGGVEWLAAIAEAGKLPAGAVEGLLDSWSRIHLENDDPLALATAEGAWLVDLAAALPARPAGFPGRGPRERALLAAVAWAPAEAPFTWGGVAYVARGEADIARRYLEVLEAQHVPSFDDLVTFAIAAADLGAAVDRRDVAGARGAGERLAAVLPGLAGRGPFDARDTPFGPRAEGAGGRERLAELLDEIARAERPEQLDRLRRPVEAVGGAAALEARPFFVVAPYLAPLAALDSLPLRRPLLSRRHRPFEVRLERARRPDEVSDAWERAGFVPSGKSDRGAYVAGSLFGVADVLAHAHVRFLGHGQKRSVTADPVFDVGYAERVRPSWVGVTAEVAAFVASASDAGEAWIEAAGAGRLPETVAARVFAEIPPARLASIREGHDRQGGRPTPSERFGVAIRVLDSSDSGAGLASLPAPVRARLEATRAALGPDWKRRAGAAGIPTPAIDGRRFRHAGPWPPYEALERDGSGDALAERLWIDLRLTVARFVETRGLPRTIARDLLDALLASMPSALARANRWDWESYAEWLHGIDDADLEEITRECLKRGPYVLRRS